MTAAAFQGTFSDFKLIRGRKCAQIVIEVSLEQADAALRALGGLPNPVDERWVAVARLNAKAPAVPVEEPKQTPASDRKRWEDMPLSQQAAIRCGEPDFRRFLDENICAVRGWRPPADSEEAAQVVRHACRVSSRSELNKDTAAAAMWKQIDNDFWAWQRGMQ